MLVIEHYIVIKICKNTIYNYKQMLNNTLFCVFSRKIFGKNKFNHYLCKRKRVFHPLRPVLGSGHSKDRKNGGQIRPHRLALAQYPPSLRG